LKELRRNPENTGAMRRFPASFGSTATVAAAIACPAAATGRTITLVTTNTRWRNEKP
jgi:hypothetical protein